MIAGRRSTGHMIDVDLTPMIDVVLQLIIFFMLTSKFGELRRTEIDLPRQPGERERSEREPALIVDLTGDGRTLVDSGPVSLLELERIAAAGLARSASPADFDVLIRPDRNAPASELDRVLGRLASIGVTTWKLGTVEPDGRGSP